MPRLDAPSSAVDAAAIRSPGRLEGAVLVALVLGAFAWSAIGPADRLTWLLEVVWVIPALPLVLLLRHRFPLTRNHYDRLGHLMQGVVPALLARELLLRRTPLRPGAWLSYLCVAAALSFSALFEMLEWWAALAWGGDADAFLATQGDVWDTQWDMFMCLLGALAVLALGSRLHDRQLGLAR